MIKRLITMMLALSVITALAAPALAQSPSKRTTTTQYRRRHFRRHRHITRHSSVLDKSGWLSTKAKRRTNTGLRDPNATMWDRRTKQQRTNNVNARTNTGSVGPMWDRRTNQGTNNSNPNIQGKKKK